MKIFSLAKTALRLASIAGLMAMGSAEITAAQSQTTLKRQYRGTTVCTAPTGANCGTDYWSLFLHADGSRVMHVTSETSRANEVRHATIVIEADGIVSEAFMHNRSNANALGSTYVLKTDGGVAQAIHNGPGLKTPSDGITVSTVTSQNDVPRSIGTGPAATDGLHFFTYDDEKGGKQKREVFWMGGSFGGTMAGVFRSTTYTHVGKESISMPQGYDIETDHFRMSSGSEIWLTKGSRIVVRADVRFGPGPAMRYELKELKVTPIGTKNKSAGD